MASSVNISLAQTVKWDKKLLDFDDTGQDHHKYWCFVLTTPIDHTYS